MSSLAVGTPDHGFGVGAQSVTLVDLLEWRARWQAERVAYTFLTEGETQSITITWSELQQKAQLIGQRLSAGGATGKPVLLLYPSDLEYVAAFFGCLYAGAIAVPAYPPRLNRTLHRLQAIVADSQAGLALSVSFIRQRIEPLCQQFPVLKSLRWLSTDDLPNESRAEWNKPSLTPATTAFLQYTSGSTSQPKGVIVSHGNLMHNEQMIQQAFGQTESSIIVGWLPLYHDMGLIGNVLQTLYVGARCVLMSPATFLQSPFRWLQAISAFKATTSGGPNFAYDLCVRKVSEEQRAQLDLSSWRVAFNGAEPIRPATLERFAAAFAPCGFKPEAFHPCYGLAEATLFVSGKAQGRPRVESFSATALTKNQVVNANGNLSDNRRFVSCGVSFGQQRLVVVNADTKSECGSGEVGEIWLAGPGVAGGYWNKPEATTESFHAHLAGNDSDAYLRTGDLGFLHDDELYVTGRLKDLIIIRGLNHYPQDLEQTAEQSHRSLRAGCGAAFSLEVDGEERLAIVYEVQRNRTVADQEIVDSIRQRIAEEHEVQVYAVALVRQGTVPKTSSGKIQRNACRRLFVDAALELETEWREASCEAIPLASIDVSSITTATEDSPEAWLRDKLAALLHVHRREIDQHQPITRYGLDSLLVVELSHSIEEQFGVAIPLAALFENISIADLSERVRQAASESSGIAESTESCSRANVSPLSPSQQSLWFLHQLAPEDPTYNLSFAARIRGPLDVISLRSAFQTLVDRHDSLRTTFAEKDGEPVQRIAEHVAVCFAEHDVFELTQAAPDQRLLAEAQRPFDLEHGPLLKVHLFDRTDGESILLLTTHHIIVDLWSLTVLIHELGVVYSAYRSGATPELPPLARQYVDYVRWQTGLLQSDAGQRHRLYWQQQLAAPLPALALPADRPRPPLQTYRGAAHSFRLDPELTGRLKALSKEQNATLYMTLLAAFQVLLYRYTGQHEIIVGSPTSGRNRGWLAGLVGYLVNPIALRASVTTDQPFADFLSEVRRTVLAAFEHQDYPFTLQVQDVQPERDASRSPIFQVMFALQKSHLRNDQSVAAFAVGDEGAQIPLGDVVLESVALPQRSARFDLTLLMADVGEHLAASLEYNTDLFDATTIQRLSRQFERLLESIVTTPQAAVSRLAILSRTERQLLAAWNETQREYPRGEGMHRLFEAHAEQTPQAVALVAGDERLTYRELNERANCLAHRLIQLGVGNEDRVGILLERSPEMVIALLAVLKAGGCYVPLDPAYPQERLAFMKDDAGFTALLTSREVVKELTQGSEPEKSVNPVVSIDERQLAYLIYTSGSTGKPKGVAIEHGSATAFIHWAGEVFNADDLRSVLFSTSVCFDLSIFEMFVTLSSGGQIVIAENALQLPELSAANEVTLINTVPSALAELLRMNAVPASVRVVNLAGEPLSDDLVAQIYATTHVERVYNLYGPTEDTTYSTYTLCRDGEHVTIGRPVANTRAYVLDEQLQPVPIGVIGDLYLASAKLARGYWSRPEMTAEKFVPDGLSGDSGARLYRTGDKARYLANGNLEFLGRADHQVKLRGYRIELGEIESVLRRHEQIQDAIVIARDYENDEKRLVAYVVAGGALRVNELRGWLRERLPEFMTPAALVLLDALPLTPNGKIDRQALPAPDFSVAEESLAAPRTQIEEVLLGIWANVLGVQQLGIHDNFFELGGHSLMATRLLSQVRHELHAEVPLSKVFESPTVARLAEHVEQVLRDAPAVVYTPVEVAPRDAPLPLSFAQQRLWFLDQMEPGNPFYNLAAVVRLQGKLNVAALQQSFAEIVNRHETLRTRFDIVDGQPVQIVMPASSWSMPLINLSGHRDDSREAELARHAHEEAQTPFDLASGTLLRTTLVQLDEQDYALLVTMHHIVSDAWSVGILIKELTATYVWLLDEQESTLPPLSIQYPDYARWQRHWLQGDVLATQMDYWKQHLQGAPALLNFPADRPRPAVQTFHGETQTLDLSDELTAALKYLSRQHGATLFMTLLAAFKTLLFRYTGQTDIVVGSPIAGRNRADIENLIGFFVNTQALRTHMSPELSFKELLAQVRSSVLEAHARQDLPFEKLVEELQPERSLSHAPIFQVMFALQNVPMPALQLRDVVVASLTATVQTAKFDFSLSFEEKGSGLAGTLEYNTDLFDSVTMTRLLERYQQLLEQVVEADEIKLGDLQLLSERERQQLLFEWNDTAMPRDSSVCVQQQFEHYAAIQPDAVALTYGEQTLSYRELNERANALAHDLRTRGVGPESIVGLSADRSLELVIGALGILKAGAAYLPLDPHYPRERVTFMLQDSGAAVLLTQEWLRSFSFSSDSENLPFNADRDNLAYVIYTSGSTGRPKGVAVSHDALLNLVAWHLSTFKVTASDRSTLLAGVSFDASIWELWPYLCCGASLDIPPDELRSATAELRDWLTQHEVTISFVPTPVAEPMLDLAWPAQTKLRTLLTGGDRLHTWPPASLPFVLVNNYGPTENTVVTTSGVVSRDRERPRALPPLGRPIENVRVYIMDQRGEPALPGVVGELWTGGESLARGYLQRPELTAESFVPDAFSGEPGARLYRTGDSTRYLPDGAIEFLGRGGSQVKVRGHRIELGEIETALRELANVREAVVQCWEPRPDEQSLVAYVVPATNRTGLELADRTGLELADRTGLEAGKRTSQEGGNAPAVLTAGARVACPLPDLFSSDMLQTVRATLREKLPDYMVPAFFVTLDELPLTENGKVDRNALPAPDAADLDEVSNRPRTPTEELLANIWAGILRVRRVGLHDNFFDLGGHSLLATQVVSRVRETFKIELPLRALFERPTIAELAQSVDVAVQSETGASLTPIERVDRAASLPLSFAQQRLWFIDKLSTGNTVYNIQVAVRLRGNLDHSALESALNEIIRRHEVLRTTFTTRNRAPVQIVAPEYSITLPLKDLSALPPSEHEAAIRQIYAAEGRHAFDLSTLPLLRFRLLKLGVDEHALLLTMHHIISDGWSLGVIVQELAALYDAFSQEQPSTLTELPVQYADFAHWQLAWLQGEVLQTQLDYWKTQLAGIRTLELPTDRPRPPVQSFRGERRSFTLPVELSQALKSFSRREGVTLYMLTLAAFKLLLARYSNQDDVVVGTDIANRNRSEIEPLVGFFANQLVLRTNLSGNPTVRELLARVREVTLGAYAHQDMPFEKLVEALQPERDLSRNPLFQVMFILQNNPMPALALGDVALDPIEISEATTAFDITLALSLGSEGELSGSVRYSTDLFTAATIERMIGHYETLLRAIIADTDARLNALEMLTEQEREQKMEHQDERRKSKLQKLLNVKPKAVKLSEQNIVTETRVSPEMILPVVFEPRIEGVDLTNWATQNRETINERLQQYGALLFRGFNTRSLNSFEQFTTTIASSLMSYGERSSPRHVLSGNIYTSTDHPADQHILLHNEQSYTLNWPMKIWFFCVRPAYEGGRTPIADSRRIFKSLPAPVIEQFVRKQVMYVRNYGDGLGLSWQEAFQTDDKRVVQEHCRRDAIEFEWKDENRLRTKQIRPAVRQHPRTGDTVWFNHAVFFNVHSLAKSARESLRAGVSDFDLPFNTFYGDGSAIEPSVIEEIYEVYRAEQVAFDWQAGDILMLDNMLVAHGREPFVAPREIAVAMAEPFEIYANRS